LLACPLSEEEIEQLDDFLMSDAASGRRRHHSHSVLDMLPAARPVPGSLTPERSDQHRGRL
jgi:hypothetical protein